jgi:hypothetical protein
LTDNKFMAYLTNLALQIDEADPGDFAWVILQSGNEPSVFVDVLISSLGTYATYAEALKEGAAAMARIARGDTLDQAQG